MVKARQTIVNRKDGPIYISIEVNPDCYELEPGDRLTLIYDVPIEGDALEVEFINDRELVIWPNGESEPAVLINGASAQGRSWKFRHQPT
jgi:hypothetical protein